MAKINKTIIVITNAIKVIPLLVFILFLPLILFILFLSFVPMSYFFCYFLIVPNFTFVFYQTEKLCQWINIVFFV